MNALIKSLFFVITLSVPTLSASAQTCSIKGVVRDLSTNQPIPAVTITIPDISIGLVTDANGTFIIELQEGEYQLNLNHVSFKEKQIHISPQKGKTVNLGNIFLESKVIGLNEVHIISSFVSERNIPVAVSTISARTIERQSGNQDYPEIMKLTPGVYATKSGGGSGDDRLTIRGFQQENVALLLNGVPVSSMENGLVYWSNWIGLTDATEAIQVQRGLGASMVAMNSVGGTVNIITKNTETQQGGSMRYSLSGYGNQKTILQLSTGKLKNGTAVTFLGSRTTGPGYVDGTYVNGWAYFLSVSREINSRHKLVLTAVGSPEHHGQQNYYLSNEEYNKYGNKYNPSWGVYKGKIFNLSENFYHKPQINLNHYWAINPKAFLATSAYVSFGYGGGRYSEAFNYGPSVWYFRKNNQIDFDAVYQNNLDNTDSTDVGDGSWYKNYSKNTLSNYKANHYWAGMLSTLNYTLTDKLKITSGIHFRTFRSRLYEEVDDLMGGDFWIEKYAWSLSGVAGRNQIKKKGDVINVDNSSMMNYGNLFGQLEYKTKRMQCFLASTLSSTGYQRKDPYNYVNDPYSEKVRKSGFDIKTGASFRFLTHLNAYANLGYYSREPYFKFIYVNYSNAVARDLRNEHIQAAETGLEFNNGRISSRLNGYYTIWKDKAMLSRENIQLADSTLTRSLVKGLGALHKGIELESSILLLKNLSIAASFSLGDWKWKNDVTASIYDDNHVLVDSTRIYTKGLYVGDAPQTQIGLSVDYTILDYFNLVANWVYYDRLYANFDPANRTIPSDKNQPFRIPGYGIADLYLTYDFEVRQFPASIQLSCQNLLDNEAITRGNDGADHTLSTFSGFWAQGRTFNVSMKLSF